MITTLLLAALACPSVTMIIDKNVDRSYTTLTALDEQTFLRAEKRCKELYKNSPCLITFIIKPDNHYHAVCGKKRRIK